MAYPFANCTTNATFANKKGISLFARLASSDQPKSAIDLIDILIHEIEKSATENWEKSHLAQNFVFEPISPSIIKSNKAEIVPFRSGSRKTGGNQLALRIDTMRASEDSNKTYGLESPLLNTGYMDPRSQNAVRRYRASAAVPESRSKFARVNTSDTSHPETNRRPTGQPPPYPSSPPSKETQRVATNDPGPSAIKHVQTEPQPSLRKPKSWVGGKLAASRPSNKVSGLGLIKQKEEASRDLIKPTSPVKARSLMKRLTGHSTPQLSANYQREEQLRKALREKAALAKNLNLQEIPPKAFNAETNPKSKRQVALSMSPPSMNYETHNDCNQTTHLSAQPFPVISQTKGGQNIFIQPKSLCSNQRSASKVSATGSSYSWRDNIKVQTKTIQPPDQVHHNNLKSSQRPSGQEPINLTRRDGDCEVPHYSPVNPKDLDYIDFRFEKPTPKPGSSSPIEPTTPVFSSDSDNSTAFSSPVGSSEGEFSAELEGSYPPPPLTRNLAGMVASITCWEDLDGCTPQFVQSLDYMRQNGRSESPELDTPTSVYSVENIPTEFQDLAPEVVSLPMDPLFEESTQKIPLNMYLPPYELGSIAGQHPWPLTKDLTRKSIRKPKPHVGQLCIPLRQPTTIELVAPVHKSLHNIPRVNSMMRTGSKKVRKSRSSTDFSTQGRLKQESLEESTRSESAPSSPVAEEELISYMTPSILVKALTKQPSYRMQMQEHNSPEDMHTIMSKDRNQVPIPRRLFRPLDIWDAPSLHAPKGGLQLRVSRKHVTRTKREWVIESAVSSTRLLLCVDQPDSPSGKRDFWDPEGNHLFGFQKTVGSTRVAESDDGKALFVVRNASLSLMPHWTLTHKKNAEEGSIQWVATGDEDFKNVVVLWGGFMVGRISVESERLRHNYIVTVKSDMNYCLMAALVTVFDDLRVDEGYF